MGAVTFSHRHLVMLALGTVVACGRGTTGTVSPSPATPEATVEQFLTAANASDLDAMAVLWGDERGPSSYTNVIPREERMQRLTIMQRLLHSDTHTLSGTSSADPAKPVVTVAMAQGTRNFTVPFTLVRQRAGGWIIREIDLGAAMPAGGPRR